MTTVTVRGSQTLKGTVSAPPSKSETIREIIASTLSGGISKITNPLVSDDTKAALSCCQALGAKISKGPGIWEIQSSGKIRHPQVPLNCSESASTLRFLMGVSSLSPGPVVLTGKPSLLKRPVGMLVSCLRELGVECFTERGGNLPPVLILGGGLMGGETSLRGDESSQYVSALLFASPKARETVRVRLSTPLESAPYVVMTLRTLEKHGIHLDTSNRMDNYVIPPDQSYKPSDVRVSGDYSSASFLLAAAVITKSGIRIDNLVQDSGLADEKIIQVLEDMGVQVNLGSDSVSIVSVPEMLSPIDIDLRGCPDLVPPLSILACFAEGTSRLRGTRRLRLKESDRISALESELSKMGAEIKAKNDRLVIEGTRSLRRADIDSHGDHRIAMMGVVAALAAEGTSIVLGTQYISKSYPNFLRDLGTLGANLDVR